MTSLNMARQLLCIYFWLRVLRCSLKRNWRLEFEARVAMTPTHRQTWLFSSTSTYHSPDLLTARGVAHLVVHGTTGSTSYETIPPVRLESSGGVLSTADMVVQRRDGPRRLREIDDDDVCPCSLSPSGKPSHLGQSRRIRVCGSFSRGGLCPEVPQR